MIVLRFTPLSGLTGKPGPIQVERRGKEPFLGSRTMANPSSRPCLVNSLVIHISNKICSGSEVNLYQGGRRSASMRSAYRRLSLRQTGMNAPDNRGAGVAAEPRAVKRMGDKD